MENLDKAGSEEGLCLYFAKLVLGNNFSKDWIKSNGFHALGMLRKPSRIFRASGSEPKAQSFKFLYHYDLELLQDIQVFFCCYSVPIKAFVEATFNSLSSHVKPSFGPLSHSSSFNVHGIIYVPDDGEMLPIEREIRDLAAGLQAIKDEQEYLVIRERVHRNSESKRIKRVHHLLPCH